jgi:hypothetical protein
MLILVEEWNGSVLSFSCSPHLLLQFHLTVFVDEVLEELER